MPSSDVEEIQISAVSSLRSKFERLAVDAAQKPHRSFGAHDLLAPDPTSPRPRANSTTEQQKPSTKSLRTASSSSNLKDVDRKGPPAHVEHASTSASPVPASPLLHPVVASGPPSPSSTLSLRSAEGRQIKAALLARKPPPPPPVTPRLEFQAASSSTDTSHVASESK